MIEGHISTIEIDTNSLRGNRVTTYLMEDEWELAMSLDRGGLVRAVSEEGHAYLAQVNDLRGHLVYLTLLGPWLAAGISDGSVRVQVSGDSMKIDGHLELKVA